MQTKQTYQMTRTNRTFLGFTWNGRCFEATPMFIFRPKGLMIWDCPPRTRMRQTMVGNKLQAVASWEPLPAELFTMAKSFEQISLLLEAGIEPPTWPDFDTSHEGYSIRIELIDDNDKPVGPPTRVAMWGFSLIAI